MNWRKVNAYVAVGITLFFFAHEFLGVLFSYHAVGLSYAFLMWVGVAFAGVHVALCLVTSRLMLGDTVRPASAKKKRHLALKWATGAALLVSAAAHALQVGETLLLFCTGLLTAILLAVHVYTGVKSLTRDLNLSSAVRTPCRVAVILATVGICAVLLAGLW